MNMIKTLTSVLLIFSLVSLFTACDPSSKEAYIKEYTEWMEELAENRQTYSERNWRNADEKFLKYSKTLYSKFEGEMNFKEKIAVGKLKVEYTLYKSQRQFDQLFEDVAENSEELREQIEYYMENDMQDDLKHLKKEARKAGKASAEAMEEIIEELEAEM